jgi:hypothetical protein
VIGVVRIGWATVRTVLASPFLFSTQLAATIQDPPVRFCTTIGLVMIFSSLRIFAARRIRTSGVPPGLVPEVISIGPVGALPWARAGSWPSIEAAAADTAAIIMRRRLNRVENVPSVYIVASSVRQLIMTSYDVLRLGLGFLVCQAQ